ncbi:hypothetical protein [Bradyrhizobium sp. sBnM-33]|jgi:hypothetical protein|uniref:hypothetical protein n=1 Tax=Bradyrhizobium sp. sBnM-33 TaxID=2831780 RepID=UPI001BD043FE|nr:hypothetical protein [Bradyrhizobium sp. sBnM-33]WOH48702.1 hypothetical protein RX328_32095 [Bradyrhizobium sp. sBnM-33]
MDERRPRTSVATASSDTELANIAVLPSSQPGHQPVTVDSTVVYCGNAESVREGFSLALSLMQTSGSLLMPDAAQPVGNLILEDR